MSYGIRDVLRDQGYPTESEMSYGIRDILRDQGCPTESGTTHMACVTCALHRCKNTVTTHNMAIIDIK